MNNLERELRKSQMDYSLKVNFYLRGIAFTPCPDCPFKGEYPAVPILQKTEKCFERCPFPIILWILSKKQFEIYEKLRKPEKKKEDAKLAIKEGKMILIKES